MVIRETISVSAVVNEIIIIIIAVYFPRTRYEPGDSEKSSPTLGRFFLGEVVYPILARL